MKVRVLANGVSVSRGEAVSAQQLAAAAGYTIVPVRRPVATLARRFGRRVRRTVRTVTRTSQAPGRPADDPVPPQGGGTRPVEAKS